MCLNGDRSKNKKSGWACGHCPLRRRALCDISKNSAQASWKRQEDAVVTLEFKSTLRLMELIDDRWGRETQTDSQVSHQAAQ